MKPTTASGGKSQGRAGSCRPARRARELRPLVGRGGWPRVHPALRSVAVRTRSTATGAFRFGSRRAQGLSLGAGRAFSRGRGEAAPIVATLNGRVVLAGHFGKRPRALRARPGRGSSPGKFNAGCFAAGGCCRITSAVRRGPSDGERGGAAPTPKGWSGQVEAPAEWRRLRGRIAELGGGVRSRSWADSVRGPQNANLPKDGPRATGHDPSTWWARAIGRERSQPPSGEGSGISTGGGRGSRGNIGGPHGPGPNIVRCIMVGGPCPPIPGTSRPRWSVLR